MGEIVKSQNLGQLIDQVFEGHAIRAQQDECGDVWFCAKDVCDAVGLGSAHKVAGRLDGDERTNFPVVDTAGRTQEMLHVSEPGLYALLGRSSKPAAKRFDRWVRHEVLPAIRRTGTYQPPALKSEPAALMLPASAPANDAAAFQVAHMLLRLAGVSEGMAAATVLADAEAHYGVALLGTRKALPVLEKPRADLNATALGALVGLSAVTTNKRLQAAGLQTRNAQGEWALTEAGKAHGEAREYVRDINGSRHSGMQVLWFASAAEVIREPKP